MLLDESFIMVYAENDQISAVPHGDFQDLTGGRAAFYHAIRLTSELRSERNQLAERVQHGSHVTFTFDRMKQDELCTMLLRERNRIRGSGQRFCTEIGRIQDSIQRRVLSRFRRNDWTDDQGWTRRIPKDICRHRAELYLVEPGSTVCAKDSSHGRMVPMVPSFRIFRTPDV